jgi:hypothetical protein
MAFHQGGVKALAKSDVLAELQSEVMTVVSDPNLTWLEARIRLTTALNGSFQDTTQTQT